MNSKLLQLKSFLLFIALFFFGMTSKAQMLEEISNPMGFTCSFFSGGGDGDLFFEYVDNSYYATIFHYDGADLTEVPLPPDNIFSFFSHSYNDNFYFSSFNQNFEQVLIEFDGATAQELAIPTNFEFANYVTNYNDLMYVSLFDNNFNTVLFNYDGTNLLEIPNPIDLTFSNYITTFNDLMYLSFQDANFNTFLYSFDGTTLTPITTVPGFSFPFYVNGTDDKFYLGFQDPNFNTTLFSFDGTVLTEIPNPPGFSFGFEYGRDGDVFYFGYFDPSFYGEIYSFNGTDLTQMPAPAGFQFPDYVTSIDNVPYFSFFDNNTFASALFFWNGTVFEEVGQPTGFEYSFFTDTLNGEAYLIYFDQNFNNVLALLDPIANEVSVIGAPAGDWQFYNFNVISDEKLFLSYFNSNFEATLFMFDGAVFTEIPNPTGKQLGFFLVEDEGTLYFRYDDNNNFTGILYKLAPNTIPTSTDNTVTTFIDIPYFFENNDFNFSDTDGDNLEGILITEVEALGNLLIDGAHVYVDDHIDVADLTTLVYFPNNAEQGLPYTFFKFKVFDGNDYSEEDYTMFINVVDPATSTFDLDLNANVKTFPNPTSSFTNLTIEAKENIGDLNLFLYTSTGQLIQNHSFDNIGTSFQHQLDVQALPSGTYFIIGKTANGDLRERIVVK